MSCKWTNVLKTFIGKKYIPCNYISLNPPIILNLTLRTILVTSVSKNCEGLNRDVKTPPLKSVIQPKMAGYVFTFFDKLFVCIDLADNAEGCIHALLI